MKIISIDVGIKNLAYCLLEIDASSQQANTLNILKWDSINLCENEDKIKKEKIICTHCKKKASSYFYIDIESAELDHKTYLCATHMKKTVKQQGEKNIVIFAIAEEEEKKKEKEKSANKIDLVSIGIAIKKHFDQRFLDITDIDHIVIENQIGPIATRMKTIQGMLVQYFIMRDQPSITFASAINKLKAFTVEKTSYKDRKKLGIEVSMKILNLLPFLMAHKWPDYFITHKKKDDLADSFLQGIWYLQSTKKCEAIKII